MSGAQLDPGLLSEFLKIPANEWEAARQEISKTAKRTDFLLKTPELD